MKITNWDFGKNTMGLVWICRNKAKTTIPRHVLGIFEIFGGGKGTPNHKSRKKYLVNILLPQ
jgi:hypothetical protein